MKSRIGIGFTLVLALALSGCEKRVLPGEAKIQVNVPAEPPPTSRTKLITLNVEDGREAFQRLFESTRRVGMSSPRRIEESNGAQQVMSVTFWGEALEDRMTLHILKNEKGQWITTGYGGVEVYDSPKGFPEYRYSRRALQDLKTWYETHVSVSDRNP